MRNRWLFPMLLLAAVIGTSLAGDPPKADAPDPAVAKSRKLSDALGRIFRRARNEDSTLGRMTVTVDTDDKGAESVTVLVEYTEGVGVGFGAKDPERDQWIYIRRERCEMLEDAAKRVK